MTGLPNAGDVACALAGATIDPGPCIVLDLVTRAHAAIAREHPGLCGIWHYARVEAADAQPKHLRELESHFRDPSNLHLIAAWQHHRNCPGLDAELPPATRAALDPYLPATRHAEQEPK